MDQVGNPLRHIHPISNPVVKTDIQHIEDISSENWRDYAGCRGRTNEMFPGYHKDITYIPNARSICKSCPVGRYCEDYILQFPMADVSGVWNGMTPRQLAAEQKRRGIKPSKPTIAAIWSELHKA